MARGQMVLQQVLLPCIRRAIFPALCSQQSKVSYGGYATQGPKKLSQKDILYMLENKDDPEVSQAIKEFLKEEYKSATGSLAERETKDSDLEFTSKIERKYAAAQIVEQGIQNTHVPLSTFKDDSNIAVKRFVAQLLALGAKAGFQEPAVEIEKKVRENAGLVDTVKGFLNKARPFMTASFHSSLEEALTEVEKDLGSSVTFDTSSEGYKKFAESVKTIAQTNKIPWQMLLTYKDKIGSVDEETENKLRREYQAYMQSAQLKDAIAELEAFGDEAKRLLDLHLSKTIEQIKKDQELAQAAAMRKVDSSKQTEWAKRYHEDIKFVHWFDSQVAHDPLNGPSPSV